MEERSGLEILREVGGELGGAIRRSALFFVVPSLLLGGGAVLDAWVAPLHSVMPAAVGVLKGVCWGAYLRFALRACGGVEEAGLGTPIVAMMLAFVGLEFGAWGALMPIVVWVLPLIDYAVMYGEGPEGALGGVLDTLKTAPGLWLGTMAALLIALLLFGFVFALPMTIFSLYADREGAWMASLVGGVLVGPLVHVAVVFRARLFLLVHGDPA